MSWNEVLVVAGGFVGSAFALARLSLVQQRSAMERLIAFLQQSVQRQEATNERLAKAVAELRHGVHENTRMLRLLAERVQIFSSESSEGS